MTNQTKQTALSAFVAECNRAQELINKLQEMVDNHFNTNPDTVNWCDLGSVVYATDMLQTAICHFNLNRED
jgi:hypothetical protein